MSEFTEESSKEQTVVSPELAQKIESAREAIVREGMDSQAVMGRNVAEQGFLEALWKTVEPYTKRFGEIQFKNLKAQGALVLSLIPFLGEGKALVVNTAGIARGFEAGKAAFQAEKGFGKLTAIGAFRTAVAAEHAPAGAIARAIEGNVVAQAQKAGAEAAANVTQHVIRGQYESMAAYNKAVREAMRYGRHVTKNAIGTAAETAGRTGKIGKFVFEKVEGGKLRALKTVSHPVGRRGIGEFFNLTPDMPLWLTLTTGVAEMLGVHGADAIPAVLQMGKNMIDMVSTSVTMGKDVLKFATDRIAGRKQNAALARAAGAFTPAAA